MQIKRLAISTLWLGVLIAPLASQAQADREASSPTRQSVTEGEQYWQRGKKPNAQPDQGSRPSAERPQHPDGQAGGQQGGQGSRPGAERPQRPDGQAGGQQGGQGSRPGAERP